MQAAFTLAAAVMLWLPQPQGLSPAKACCAQSTSRQGLLQHKQLCLLSRKHACLVGRRLVLQPSAVRGSIPTLPAMHIIKLLLQGNSST